MSHRLGRMWRPNPAALFAIVAVLAAIAATAGAQPAINEWGVPTSSSQPAMLAQDSSGNIWFTETAGNKIAKINQNGVFQEFDVPTASSQPWGIAVDSGGRIWFTEAAGNKIGNMTQSGVFGQDNVPTADAQPRGLALDNSNNVWFAESNKSKIGKFSISSNAFTEFDIPTSSSQPWGVAIDGSGNLWFTERNSNKIGRMSPQGTFVEYQVPTTDSKPTGIAIDASGNIWFTEYDGNKIGMMTTGGTFTEYTLASGARPYWITVDRAMGVVWYTGYGNNSFGKIQNGTVTEYGVPTSNSSPFGILVDTSGNVWFSEQTANKIGKAIGASPQATPTPVPPTATPVPPAPSAPHDNRYFPQTAFRIDNDVFWDYFNKRGGIRTFGYPVSRTFTFLGFTTQFFQRSIMQLAPDGSPRTMNVLDPGLLPYTRINGSTFPGVDAALTSAAPVPGSADYGTAVQQFVQNNAPNQFEGLNVNFYTTFVNTVTLNDAYPTGGGNAGLLPLLNLEMWGVPTSRPMRDPNNSNFVYLRFQRGIMHFDATNGYTQGLLLADYLKSIMTKTNLPGDLEEQARGGVYYGQYNQASANWVERPDQLPNTNLLYAFERQ